ncbi:MAG: endonuclease domain-containing protein [Akkermansia sp.]
MRDKNHQFTGYNHGLLEYARDLRREMTRQEKHLWYDFLRSYPVKVYRQRSIDHFIADFYCSRAHLVIEVDGGQHYTAEGMTYDEARTRIMNQYGVDVIRLSNADVDTHFADVCAYIDQKIKEGLTKWTD